MKSKQHILEQPLCQREIRKKIRRYLETNKNENTTYQNLWDKKSSAKKIYSNKNLYSQRRKISNQQSNFTVQGTRKIKTN